MIIFDSSFVFQVIRTPTNATAIPFLQPGFAVSAREQFENAGQVSRKYRSRFWKDGLSQPLFAAAQNFVSIPSPYEPLRVYKQGRKGGTVPRAPNDYGGAESLCGALKSPDNATSTFFKTVHLLPKDLRFEHWAPNLLLAPGAI